MILFLLASVLTVTQQDWHDALELAMYDQLRANDNAIADIWRPSPKLLSDQRKARRCYTQFHLYKVEGCEREFSDVGRDLNAPKP